MNELNPGTPSEATELTLRDMLAPLFRRRRLMILAFCGVFLGATLFAWLWAARYYEAKMEVLVKADRTDPAITPSETSPILNNALVTADQINSEVAILQGGDMLTSVVSICGLDQGRHLSDFLLPSDPVQRQAKKVAKAAKSLAQSLHVEVEKVSDVINVTYGKTGDPETPACVLATLGKLYMEKHLQLRRPAGSFDFFVQQTERYQNALADAEARLANFGPKEQVAAPDQLRTDMAQVVANSVASIHQAQQTIAADEQRIKEEEAQMAATPARSATQQVSNSADILLQQLQTGLLSAQLKRTQLLLKYESSYPLVKEADQEIADTLAAISQAQKTQYVNQTTDRDPTYELMREDIAKTRADLASQKALAAAVEHSIQSMQMRMVTLDEKAVRQAALIREVKTDEANYLLYLNKREQERTADALDKKRIANVAIAVPPSVPALPTYNPIWVMLIGFFLAAFVSVGAAFVAEYIDPSFRTPAEVCEILNIPVLASIPKKAA